MTLPPLNPQLVQRWSPGYQRPVLFDESQPLRNYNNNMMDVDVTLPAPHAHHRDSSNCSLSSSITRQSDCRSRQQHDSNTSIYTPAGRSPGSTHSDVYIPFVPTDRVTSTASKPSSERQKQPQRPIFRPDGKIPNRCYYPSSRHQEAFDTLLATDPDEIERRESVGLNVLEGDLKEPPIYSTPVIIQCAILGAPHQSLTLSELRITLKLRFQYYDVADANIVKTWERTLLRTLSDHTRFQCSKRMGPSGASWTINHNAPPIKCVPKRQRQVRRRLTGSIDQLSHPNFSPSEITMDYSTSESDVTASTSSGRSPSLAVDTRNKHDEVQSLFPIGPASGPHGRYIKLPPLPLSRKEWCPTSPRLWSRSDMPFRDTPS